MKKLLFCLPLVFLFGCGTTNQPLTRTVVTSLVKNGIKWGVQRSTNAAPYLEAAAPIVCSVANGTNLSPAVLTAALDAIPIQKPPEAGLLIDFVVSTYDGYFEHYVDNWTANQPFLQSVLLGCCDGMNQGLAAAKPGVMMAQEKWVAPHTK
jgi:hypothetical protein